MQHHNTAVPLAAPPTAPLHTYLGSAVRPRPAAVAAPVARPAPVAAPYQATQPPQTTQQQQVSLFQPQPEAHPHLAALLGPPSTSVFDAPVASQAAVQPVPVQDNTPTTTQNNAVPSATSPLPVTRHAVTDHPLSGGVEDEPVASPEEKLSAELARLFHPKPVPKPKLAAMSTLPAGSEGLAQLARAGCWRELVRRAELLVNEESDPRPHERLNRQTWHAQALLRLRKLEACAALLSKIGPLWGPDKLASSYPQLYEQESHLVPLELHLVAALLPLAQGRPRAALDQLCSLLSVVRLRASRATAGAAPQDRRPSHGASEWPTAGSPHLLSTRSPAELQEETVTVRFCLVSACLSQSEPDIEGALSWLTQLAADAPQPKWHEWAARIALQAGDVHRATQELAAARELYVRAGDEQNLNIQLHAALLQLAHTDFNGAHQTLATLYQHHPTNVDVASNYAVSCLYVNRLSDGVTALEQLLREDVTRALTPAVLSNLRALYNLASPNPALSIRMLEGLVLMYGDDSISVETQ